MPYNPQKDAVVISKPFGAIGFPIDSRSFFYDEANFVRRAFISTAEVLAYFDTPFKREGMFYVFVNSTGTLQPDGTILGGTRVAYWWKEGTADNQLIVVVEKGDKGDKGNTGEQGIQGFNGWQQETEIEVVNVSGVDKTVRKLVGYFGGTGTEPTLNVGKYEGVGGWVTDPIDAVDFLNDASSEALALKANISNLGEIRANSFMSINGLGGYRISESVSGVNITGGYNGNEMISANSSVISGGGQGGNIQSITGNFSSIGGGYDNVITNSIASTISGGAHHRVLSPSTHSAVGGGSYHNITGGDYGTIAGGTQCTVSANGASIGGGTSNTASGAHSVVAGGTLNSSIGGQSAILGGQGNSSGGISSYIGAGQGNTISNTSSRGDYSSILGGLSNSIGTTQSGEYSTILGGRSNTVNGTYGVVGGRRAKTIGNGNWAFSDSQDADFTVTDITNTIGMRFSGGYWMTGGSFRIGTPTADNSIGGKLQVLSSTTGQTADAVKVINATTAGSTFNTTAGALTNYSGYFVNAASRLTGSNDLTNVALYASASGGQNNYAAIFNSGNIGMGNTTPIEKLDVTGKIRASVAPTNPTDVVRLSDMSIVNTTTTALTSANLNSTYPNVIIGFRVICHLITGAPVIYTKATENGSSDVWLTTTATITP